MHEKGVSNTLGNLGIPPLRFCPANFVDQFWCIACFILPKLALVMTSASPTYYWTIFECDFLNDAFTFWKNSIWHIIYIFRWAFETKLTTCIGKCVLRWETWTWWKTKSAVLRTVWWIYHGQIVHTNSMKQLCWNDIGVHGTWVGMALQCVIIPTKLRSPLNHESYRNPTKVHWSYIGQKVQRHSPKRLAMADHNRPKIP